MPHNSFNLGRVRPVFGAMAAAAAVALSGSAQAAASYDAGLTFRLLMPAATLNEFGFGGPNGLMTDSDTDILGNAAAFATEATMVTDSQPGRVGRKVDGASVVGAAAAPFGYSYAESQGALSSRMINMSGSGYPTPPAHVFNATFDLSYNYALQTHIDDPLLDYADASFDIYFRTRSGSGGAWSGNTSILSRTISGTDHVNGNGTLSFVVPLAPNSTTVFDLQFYVNGTAWSIELPPPPVIPPPELPPTLEAPEPGAIMLTLAGLAVVAARARRSRHILVQGEPA